MPSSSGDGDDGGIGWSREEEKAFENALATAPEKSEDDDETKDEAWLGHVAASVPDKTVAEVKRHYEILVEDVNAIEAGKVPLPRYVGEEVGKEKEHHGHGHHRHHHGEFADRRVGGGRVGGGGGGGGEGGVAQSKASSKLEQERRKGIPWKEEEHRLFLLGLDKFGKGDWRSISRNFVISRTPTQVASHAQKYFIRMNSMNRDRRRSSIHDITMVNGGEVASPQGPITGQANGNPAPVIGPPSMKHHPQHFPPPSMHAMGMYGPPIGHPVTGHMVSAVGTPVMLPHGHSPYVLPVAYPVPPSAMHQ